MNDNTKHIVHEGYLTIPKRFQDSNKLVLEYKNGIYNHPGDRKFETARANYFHSKVDYRNATVLDIGCNTAYFLLEALDRGASFAYGFEGCKESIKLIDKFMELEKRLKVTKDYYDFGKNGEDKYDIIHLLNVMHHIGRDFAFSNYSETIQEKHAFILNIIDSLAGKARYMIFQIGFNQKGDISIPLFKNGTKEEQVHLIKNGLKNWIVESIGVAAKNGDYIEYQDLNSVNIKRNDSLGEFLNRPIFILKSKTFQNNN